MRADSGLILGLEGLAGNVSVDNSQFSSLPGFIIVSNSTVRFSNVTFNQGNTNGPGLYLSPPTLIGCTYEYSTIVLVKLCMAQHAPQGGGCMYLQCRGFSASLYLIAYTCFAVLCVQEICSSRGAVCTATTKIWCVLQMLQTHLADVLCLHTQTDALSVLCLLSAYLDFGIANWLARAQQACRANDERQFCAGAMQVKNGAAVLVQSSAFNSNIGSTGGAINVDSGSGVIILVTICAVKPVHCHHVLVSSSSSLVQICPAALLDGANTGWQCTHSQELDTS